MIDTLAVQWQGIPYTPEFAEWLRERYPTAHFHQAAYDAGLNWGGVTFQDDVLGTLQVKSNKLGNYVRAERSIPKFMYEENCRVLSVDEATEGIAGWVAGVEALFADWWEIPNPHETAKVQRVDLCYQTHVPGLQDALQGLYKGLNLFRTTRYGLGVTPAQMHLTGLTLRRSALELSRWYDKGWESGNERYIGVLRHEEQLRRGKAGYYVDLSGPRPVLKAEEARQRMNARYERWGGRVNGISVRAVLEEHGLRGGAALALVARPDWEPEFKSALPKATFYKVRALSYSARQSEFTVDLTLPEDAWAEPMVL